MFSIPNWTKAKVADVVILSQKNRQPDDAPGVKLKLEMTLSNDALSEFDGHLLGFLFTKNANGPKQGNLDGIAVADRPDLTTIGAKVGQLRWAADLSGYSMEIDLGLGGKRSNLAIEDCTISGIRFLPKQGGTLVFRCNLESPDVSEASFGKLAKLKSREAQIKLIEPEVRQGDLDEEDDHAPAPPTRPSAKKTAAKPDATDAFIAQHAKH